jgi:hypothetical protein
MTIDVAPEHTAIDRPNDWVAVLNGMTESNPATT